ncbi:MAG: nucleoside deaminase [Myxococcota bacterium]
MGNDDILFMKEALLMAQKAYLEKEVPVGSVIVDRNGEIIGRGYNLKESAKLPILHSEIIAILNAYKNFSGMYLIGCTLYTTLEPCPMCAAALVNIRISRIVFAADDPKYGACGSVFNLASDPHLNHRIEVMGGVLRDESVNLIKTFFSELRREDE